MKILITILLLFTSLTLVAKEAEAAKKADIETATAVKDEDPLRVMLGSIVISKVVFKDTRVSSVLDFLKTRSKAIDVQGIGVNFVLKLSKGKEEPRVSMDLEEVTLGSVVKHICKETGLKYQVTDKAVLIGEFNTTDADKSSERTK